MSTELVASMLGAGEYALPLEESCVRFGIESVNEKCHLLANCSIESRGFTSTTESLDFTPARLKEIFSRRRISAADANRLGRIPGRPANQRELARVLYNNFPGRGLIQLTWRDNYLAYSLAMYGDDRILRNPELVAMLPDAALSAGWYFSTRVPRPLSRTEDVAAVRRKINTAGLHTKEVAEKFWLARRFFEEMVR